MPHHCFTMEDASSSFVVKYEDDFPALRDTTRIPRYKNQHSSRAVDIGCERSRVVSSRYDSLALISFDPMPGGGFVRNMDKSITLSRSTVKNFYDKLGEIREKVEELSQDALEDEYNIYLGQRIYLILDPMYKCVSLRKFYTKANNKNCISPGYPGFTFKLEEFSKFCIEFAEIEKVMSLSKLETTCNPDQPCSDEACNNCKMN